MNRLSKKFYIISFSIIIILGIIAGILLVTKSHKKDSEDYTYNNKTAKTYTINDLTDKEKEIIGLGKEAKLEDKNLYTNEYKKYLEASDEEKNKSDIIPRKYEVPFEKLDDIQEDLEKKETIIDIKDEEIDPETNLPKKFNLADKIDIKVEDQGNYGLCWAFASLKSLETYAALNNLGNFDFSEIHIDYLESELLYGDRPLHDGGSFYYFQKYINEFGVVPEEAAPYREMSESEYNTFADMPKALEVTETIEFPYMDKNIGELYSNEEYNEKEKEFRKTVKEHILKNGGIYTAIIGTTEKNLYTPKDAPVLFPNHAVTIVGWDDNYSKNNFSNYGQKPEHDGAYIALNSWGTSYNDKGYFYISYDDLFVETDMNGIASTNFNNVISLESIGNSAIKQYLEERFGHLLIEKDGKKYVTQILLDNITELDLSNRNITSLAGIDIFQNVYYLDLSDNSISDITPIKNMKSLGHLDLSNNNISNISSLPNSNLPNLSYIDLKNNKLGNVSSLANLPTKNLYGLLIDLSENKGITGLDAFNSMDVMYLTILANNCGLNKLPNYKETKNITSLSLENNNITSGFENLPQGLSSLNLSGNNISDITEIINKDISIINLANNNITTIPKITYTKNSYLELDISNNPIENWSFLEEIELPKKEYGRSIDLYMDGCNISDISIINKIPSEEISLSLKNNNITDLSQINEETNNKILSIDLSGNKGLIGLEHINHAREVILQDCDFTNLDEIEKLESVETLDLKNNKIKDVSKISNLKKLLNLSLEGNKDIEGVINSKSMFCLNLNNCNLNNDFNLSNLDNLYLINLKGNPDFTQISELVNNCKKSIISITIDKLDYSDYEKIQNNKDKYISVSAFEMDIGVKDVNSQIDLSDYKVIKNILMKKLSSGTIKLENATMTKKGYILDVINTNEDVKIYLDDYYWNDNPTTINCKILHEEINPEPTTSEENIINEELQEDEPKTTSTSANNIINNETINEVNNEVEITNNTVKNIVTNEI